MSAHQHMCKLLDELMGTKRNGDNSKGILHFSSNRVCKCFLLNCCPHDILSATRCDLGKCPKVHDFAIRADYQTAEKNEDLDFYQEALEQLKTFITEADRRSQIAKRRLADTQQILTAEQKRKLHKIENIVTKIEEAIADSERLGADGKVDESLEMIEKLELLYKEKILAEDDYANSIPTSFHQQQKLRVCEVCSCYLGYSDGDKRLNDHMNGKMHLGFVTIREKIGELEDSIREKIIQSYLEKEFGNHTGESKKRKSLDR